MESFPCRESIRDSKNCNVTVDAMTNLTTEENENTEGEEKKDFLSKLNLPSVLSVSSVVKFVVPTMQNSS